MRIMAMVCYRLWQWYVTALGNRLWKRKGTVWASAYGNRRELFGQPLMETEGDCLSNRFIQPKQVTQHSMQPL
jgi:hypothetical protein